MTRNQAFGALLGLLKIKFNIPGLFFESLNIQVFGISPNQSYDMGHGDVSTINPTNVSGWVWILEEYRIGVSCLSFC